jgi:cardiolipin synthase
MSGTYLVAENRLTLLKNGAEYFPQLCAAIDAAQHSIYLETYIYAADATGRMIADALGRAAARGVNVRLVLDGFGSAELPQRWVDEMRTEGIEVQWFRRKISPLTLRRSRLRRLHRKLVVMDGETAFVGGINIVDDIPPHSDIRVPRLDYAVRIQGPVAGEIHVAMRHLWGMVSRANFHRHGRHIHWRLRKAYKHSSAASDVELVLRDNVHHRRDIERAYLRAIAEAQHEIIIANAYFLPGRAFRRALKQARQRGVRVLLLLQGKVEYRLQHYATHALYEQLLTAGVEIYEYEPSYLHAKVAVVDGKWATVGSSNIDPFSLFLAREANLVVRDAGFAGEVRESLMNALASEMRCIESARDNFFVHWLARLSYGLVRLLAGIVGMSRRQ